MSGKLTARQKKTEGNSAERIKATEENSTNYTAVSSRPDSGENPGDKSFGSTKVSKTDSDDSGNRTDDLGDPQPSKSKKNKKNLSMSKNNGQKQPMNTDQAPEGSSLRKDPYPPITNHFTGTESNGEGPVKVPSTENTGEKENKSANKTRVKTAKNGRGMANNQNGNQPTDDQAAKANGHSDASKRLYVPRSGGSDGSDSDKKVSFRDNLEDHSDAPESLNDSSPPPIARERVSSWGKKLNPLPGLGIEKQTPMSAREPLTHDNPKPEGSPMWRKICSDPALPKSAREPRELEALSDDLSWERQERFSPGRGDYDFEPSGRKFTRKSGKAVFGSTTTLSSNTDNSDDSDDVFNVVLRVRPLNNQEKNRRDKFVADFPGDGQVTVSNSGTHRSFQFNVVFEPDAAQEDVFENSGIKKLVEAALSGYTCTAFAFGQTGSGKTHTMTGPPAQFHTEGVTPDPKMYGIMQRSFKYLFQSLKKQGTAKIIRASYLEIYNEQVIDLLNNSHRRYLAVRWSKNKGFYVENLFTVECETIDDLMAVLEEGKPIEHELLIW